MIIVKYRRYRRRYFMEANTVFVLFLLAVFLFFISKDATYRKEGRMPSVGPYLPRVIKGLQIVLLGYVFWHMVELIYYLYNHTFIVGMTAHAGLDAIAGYEALIMTFSLIATTLFFLLLEISHKIASELTRDFKFSHTLIQRSKLILYLFIIYIFAHVIINTIIFGSITLSIEYIVLYVLLIAIMRTFIRAASLQRDNDMVI